MAQQLPPARDVEASEEDDSQRSSPSGTAAKKPHPLNISKQPTRASRADLTILLDQVMAAPTDNAELLRRIEERMARVGLTFPGIEVRWKNLTAEAVLPRGSEHTTTLWTTLVDMVKAMTGVFVPEKHTHVRHVMLDGVSGVLKPGRMTLLLGPPGAGKSTLLRSLAGQMGDATSVRFTGEVTYNGQVPGSDFVVERAAAYVGQEDEHIPNMTVAETLYFASEMLGPGLSKAVHGILSEREKEMGIKPDPDVEAMWLATFQDKRMSIWVNLFTRLLGVEHVMDTVVGDQQLKGISGGQRRRVTSAELAVGLLQCMFLDEISTGLDSATTFQMVQGLGNLCRHMNGTYVISLLQPAPETYDLFDDIMVMAGRRIVYHGPRDGVLPFFATLGFTCPPSKTVPDFLQEVVTSTDQKLYWDGSRGAQYSYVSSKKIAAQFQQTAYGKAQQATLDSPPHQHELQDKVLHKHEYAQSWWSQLGTVLRREVKLATKPLGLTFLVFNVFQMAFISFITATTFPQLPKDDFNNANLFLSVVFFSLMNI